MPGAGAAPESSLRHAGDRRWLSRRAAARLALFGGIAALTAYFQVASSRQHALQQKAEAVARAAAETLAEGGDPVLRVRRMVRDRIDPGTLLIRLEQPPRGGRFRGDPAAARVTVRSLRAPPVPMPGGVEASATASLVPLPWDPASGALIRVE